MLLDTNILVRHLTGQPRSQASRATTLLTSQQRLVLPSLIVAELVYVLTSVYDVERSNTAALVRAVLAFHSIEAPEHSILVRALEHFEAGPLDFADAVLAATAEATGASIASFDRDFDRIPTVNRVEP